MDSCVPDMGARELFGDLPQWDDDSTWEESLSPCLEHSVLQAMVMEAGAAQEVFDEISVKGTECKVPVGSDDALGMFDTMPCEVTWDEEMQDYIGNTHAGLLHQLALGVVDKNTKDSAPVLLGGMFSQEVAHEVCDEWLGKVRWDDEFQHDYDSPDSLLQQLACGREYPDDNQKLIRDERLIGENQFILNLHSNIKRPLPWCGDFYDCEDVDSNQVAESTKDGADDLDYSQTTGAYLNGSLPLQFSPSTSDLGSILVKQVFKFEEEVREAKKNNQIFQLVSETYLSSAVGVAELLQRSSVPLLPPRTPPKSNPSRWCRSSTRRCYTFSGIFARDSGAGVRESGQGAAD